MSKKIKYLLAVVSVVILAVSAMGGYAFADDEEEPQQRGTVVISYTEIPLYIENAYIGSGMKLESVTYVPLLAFCEAMLMEELEVSWDQEEEFVEIEAEGLLISLRLEDNYMTANGRYLYLQNGAYNINGTIIAPIREVCRIFGIEVEWDDDDWTITIDNSEIEILEDGEDFYDEEEVDLLARLISAESGNQPIDGKIGVGNVVLNRVDDDSGAFPDTIEEVIYQDGQFQVVERGAINLPANEMSIVAAMLCLEGYNTVGDSLYFHNPTISTTKWFEKNKTFETIIADHEFFS